MAEKYHVVFKTHLDVGFTDFARVVERRYLDEFVPDAVALAQRLNGESGEKRFVWTVGSWLIRRCLDVYRGGKLRRFENALAVGDITWHAMPFTVHSELLTPSLFDFGLSISCELDRQFGKRTRAAKLTDVPGHTRAVVSLLAGAGIDFLHIGSNPGSTPPDLPELFTWENPIDDSRITVIYQSGGYGKVFESKDIEPGLFVTFTEDNLGPPSAEEVQKAFRYLEDSFPGIPAAASTLDAFAGELFSRPRNLPVVNKEIGDTWIHGAGTAPGKVRKFRELCRLRDEWIAEGVSKNHKKRFYSFSENLLLVGEHTWGLDVKSHLKGDKRFAPGELKKSRRRKDFKKMEESWAEQEAYIEKATLALRGTRKGRQAIERLDALEPKTPDLTDFEAVGVNELRFDTKHFEVGFSERTGGVDFLKLKSTGGNIAGKNNQLGTFSYQVFGSREIERFLKQYGFKGAKREDWFPRDFGKPGLEKTLERGTGWTAKPSRAFLGKRDGDKVALIELVAPAGVDDSFGFPKKLYVAWRFPDSAPRVDVEITWDAKPANGIPEAAWFGFAPRVENASSWMMDKMGQWVSPLDVVKNGNRKLHAVAAGVRFDADGARVYVDSADAPLVAPGAPSLYDFNNRRPPLSRGMYFNLFNNVWGTNFPQWSGESALFRFSIRF